QRSTLLRSAHPTMRSKSVQTINRSPVCFLLGRTELIFEVVGVRRVGDRYRHRTAEPGQLAGARIRHNANRELLHIACHRAVVYEREGAAAPVQRTLHAL